ncbi:Protein NPR-15, partial [Aphelenchoides avenae]
VLPANVQHEGGVRLHRRRDPRDGDGWPNREHARHHCGTRRPKDATLAHKLAPRESGPRRLLVPALGAHYGRSACRLRHERTRDGGQVLRVPLVPRKGLPQPLHLHLPGGVRRTVHRH